MIVLMDNAGGLYSHAGSYSRADQLIVLGNIRTLCITKTTWMKKHHGQKKYIAIIPALSALY